MPAPITITADGKCPDAPSSLLRLLAAGQHTELELTIDGTLMAGGKDTLTLLGASQAFLPSSYQFTLTHFEPLPDGRCRVRYTATACRPV